MKEPTKFITQREAWWYVQGLKDALVNATDIINREIDRYDLNQLDHLPEGTEVWQS